MSSSVQLVECPRDAIQGIHTFIPTTKKIAYINDLIASDLFEYIDCGSFVSPKAVPQMQDTADVLAGIEKVNNTKLLAIVANERGAEQAIEQEKIDFLGYPFSISETFQQRNTNSSIEDSFERVKSIADKTMNSSKELVVYISMAFGNPYGDHWHEEMVLDWIEKLQYLGINRFSIADTTSEASEDDVKSLFLSLNKDFPTLDFSAHLHSRIESALLKIDAAFHAGCRRFEGAFLGFGGCPFAQDDLVGNIPMELLLDRFQRGTTESRKQLMQGFEELIR